MILSFKLFLYILNRYIFYVDCQYFDIYSGINLGSSNQNNINQ